MQELDIGEPLYFFFRGNKIKGANSCKLKNMINKTKKFSHLYLNILLIFGIVF
jgi:hypothetical protein